MTKSEADPQAPQPAKGSRNRNPAGVGFWKLVGEDYRTHDRDLLHPGFWALAVHRFGNWRMGIRFKVFRAPFTLLYRMSERFVVLAFGILISYSVPLGRRVKIWHHGGVFISAASIGDDVHFRQNTAIGIADRNHPDGLPVIEDRVDVYSGACIAGDIRIGHDAVIGANSVVSTDVPPGAVMVGNPARRVPGTGQTD